MVAPLIVLAILLSLALVALAALARQHLGRVGSTAPVRDSSARRILFPVAESGLSTRTLEAALRLANAERSDAGPDLHRDHSGAPLTRRGADPRAEDYDPAGCGRPPTHGHRYGGAPEQRQERRRVTA